MRLPNFVIVGGEKCGTTLLRSALAAHPEIFMPKNEIAYFADPDFQTEKIEDFAHLFDKAGDKKVLGFYRSDYLYLPEVSKRIKKILPNSKIIVIIRDPIGRLLSAYFHHIDFGFIPAINPEKGIQLLLESKLKKTYPRSSHILEYSFYAKGLANYFKVFGKDRILVLSYSELKKNPEQFVRKAYQFLNVDDNFVPEIALKSRPGASSNSLLRARFRAWTLPLWVTFNRDHTRVYPKKRTFLVSSLISLMNFVDNQILASILSSKKSKLTPALSARLENYYHDDQVALQKFLLVTSKNSDKGNRVKSNHSKS